MDDHDFLHELFDADEPIVWPFPDRPPAHPAARRLLEALGVIGIPEERMSVQEATETRVCAQTLCTADAMRMSMWCRRHAPITELAAERENGHQADGRAALAAMDAGEPQVVGSVPLEQEDGAKIDAVLAQPAKKHSHNPWTRE